MTSMDFAFPLIERLRRRGPLDEADVAAVRALPLTSRTYEPPAYLVREGMTAARSCCFIRSGFAIRQKLTTDGHRQIVGISLPGDFVDFQHLFLGLADHNIQALTSLETVEIERTALQELVLHRPNVSRAVWTEALVEASIQREWTLNIGRRDARQRVAHLLCEFALRASAAGLNHSRGYELPMTQEQLGDAVGLTSVHINRTLKSLAADGVLQRDRRHISFDNWEKIRVVGDFSALYLHLDQLDGARLQP